MRIRYIPAMVMLFAGAIASIMNMVQKVEKVTALKRLIVILLIFYILGLIAKAIINKTTVPKKSQQEDSSN